MSYDTVWNDRVTKIGNTTISYDQIGNPLNWTDNATLTWQRGRQLASFNRGSTSVSYTYNDEGIRTSKTVNGTTTTYNILDGTLRSMSDGTNTLQFFENSVYFNNVEYWYVYNAQNDIIGLINASGEYVVEYTYSAYGMPLSKTGTMADTLGTLNPFRYRGYIYDEETALCYCNSRYYDPSVGRWLNADVYVSTGQSVIGHNMSAYCDNNSINFSDPSGEYCSCALKPDLDVCLYCGRLNPQKEQEILDEHDKITKYTVYTTNDMGPTNIRFSATVYDYHGKPVAAFPTFKAEIVDDGMGLIPSFNYKIEIIDSSAYILDDNIYLTAKYELKATWGVEVSFFTIGIPFGKVYGASTTMLMEGDL